MIDQQMPTHLPSLTVFTDAELRVLAHVASNRARDVEAETSRAWRGMWAEIAVAAAEELERRRDLLIVAERVFEGWSAEPGPDDVGKLLGPDDVQPPQAWPGD